ncbi:hypothetical protein M1307_00175 [Patescibacteria group bacterium]|nr:hypothetical protein [Patescibacteria group bacterium]
MAVSENRPVPPVSKILIKKDGRKISVTPMAVKIEKEKIVLSNVKVPLLPYDEQDFYLNEDLLDKQTSGGRIFWINR